MSLEKTYNFAIWTMQTITATGSGLVELHNYIFFNFLTPVLAFVLLAIVLILVDSYVNIQSYKFRYKDNDFLFVSANKLIIFLEALYAKSVKEITVHRFEVMNVNKIVHGTIIEIIWTLLPSLILILIAIPSFALLYSMDEVVLPNQVIRVIGHQWYWSYENVGGINDKSYRYNFDAYMVADRDLIDGELRLLETDHSLAIPVNTHLRFLFTSTDVLHSWTIPSLGIKVDAVPGRLSQFNTYIEYDKKNLPSHEIGLELYGQCSEICGVNHGFMPISIILT